MADARLRHTEQAGRSPVPSKYLVHSGREASPERVFDPPIIH